MTFDNLVQLIEANNLYSHLSPEEAYNKAFEIGKRIPELEKIILTNPFYTVNYAMDFLKERWPEGEKALLKDGDIDFLSEYARHVMKERWLEVEYLLKLKPKVWGEYINFLNSIGYEDLEESYRSGKRLA